MGGRGRKNSWNIWSRRRLMGKEYLSFRGERSSQGNYPSSSILILGHCTLRPYKRHCPPIPSLRNDPRILHRYLSTPVPKNNPHLALRNLLPPLHHFRRPNQTPFQPLRPQSSRIPRRALHHNLSTARSSQTLRPTQ